MAKINYEHKTWYNKTDTDNASNRIPISATHLNRIEDGIQESFDKLAYSNFKNLVVQKIHSSCEWIAPKAVNNTFRVFCVGGGGGGGTNKISDNEVYYAGGGGGGGGGIQVSDITVEPGTKIDIICGAGGAISADGGSTSFGGYLTAEGGTGGKTAISYLAAGDGGSGGSGGGGGGAGTKNSGAVALVAGNGGHGGLYGGGGGGGKTAGNATSDSYTIGLGGLSTKCGNGGTVGVISTAGKQIEDPFIDCLFQITYIKGAGTAQIEGYGSGGICSAGGATDSVQKLNAGGGGGGYCGNGGNSGLVAGGGGGGYCGNGGNGSATAYYGSGGGGGGFFCDGGNGGQHCAGGGGGFFCDGADGGKSGYGWGGDGGVLIMYIKDDTEEEA